MATYTKSFIILGCLFGLLFQGCNNRKGVWDQNNTAMHLKDKDATTLWGANQLNDDKEGVFGISDAAFIALNEDDLKSQFADVAIAQSSLTPGVAGSGIPGISHFKNPTAILTSIFRTLHFNTNTHILRSQEYLSIVARVASYLKDHPNMYIFITGNCDERGPEAYNMALGTRRANYVRTLLVQKGVDPENIFTISYGKEKPADIGHNHRSWAKNRRAEFKIYEK